MGCSCQFTRWWCYQCEVSPTDTPQIKTYDSFVWHLIHLQPLTSPGAKGGRTVAPSAAKSHNLKSTCPGSNYTVTLSHINTRPHKVRERYASVQHMCTHLLVSCASIVDIFLGYHWNFKEAYFLPYCPADNCEGIGLIRCMIYDLSCIPCHTFTVVTVIFMTLCILHKLAISACWPQIRTSWVVAIISRYMYKTLNEKYSSYLVPIHLYYCIDFQTSWSYIYARFPLYLSWLLHHCLS